MICGLPSGNSQSLYYLAGLIRFRQEGPHDAGSGAQSQSGPSDEPVSLNGGGYMTWKTKKADTSARTAAIAANSPNPKDSFGDFDGFQRNLGAGLFIKRVGQSRDNRRQIDCWPECVPRLLTNQGYAPECFIDCRSAVVRGRNSRSAQIWSAIPEIANIDFNRDDFSVGPSRTSSKCPSTRRW